MYIYTYTYTYVGATEQFDVRFGASGDDANAKTPYAQGADPPEALGQGQFKIVKELNNEGYVAVTSTTSASLVANGQASSILVSKFDLDGNLEWATSIGQGGFSDYNNGFAVCMSDGAGIIVAGSSKTISAATTQVFVARLFWSGGLDWAYEHGKDTVSEYAMSCVVDGNDIFIGGVTNDNNGMGSQDGLMLKLDGSGTLAEGKLYGDSTLNSIVDVLLGDADDDTIAELYRFVNCVECMHVNMCIYVFSQMPFLLYTHCSVGSTRDNSVGSTQKRCWVQQLDPTELTSFWSMVRLWRVSGFFFLISFFICCHIM
jgi:hypothetical protein